MSDDNITEEMQKHHVMKRNGDYVNYDRNKIVSAIEKASEAADNEMSPFDIEMAVIYVEHEIAADEVIDIEQIQDAIEVQLMRNNFNKTAREFIRYRSRHAQQREAAGKFMESFEELLFADAGDMDLKRDNANIDGNAPMGTFNRLASEGAKVFADNYGLPEKFVEPDKTNHVHWHDKDLSFITFNCCQIDAADMLKNGFGTGHGKIREPNSIRSAAALVCILIQANQNDQFGGQSINALDFALAPYVNKSFEKALTKAIFRTGDLLGYDLYHLFPDDIKKESIRNFIRDNNIHYGLKGKELTDALEKIETRLFGKYGCEKHIRHGAAKVYRMACNDTEEETYQALEALVHNFNTLHSRAGGQVPFSSVNFGMDTSPAGRLVSKALLKAVWEGLGDGETPIFPISIFQLKEGINYNPEDPNYDLFKESIKVSAKRLFPNFENQDATYNIQYYDPKDPRSFVATMGCRTRTYGNVNGPSFTAGRGNFSFTTINLPMLALEAKGDIDKFFELFDKYINISREYLEFRYNIIAHKKVKNFPFLMKNHVWMDSEKLGPEDEIASVLKHASLSIGFCGLAECLVALTGHHHGESEEAQELGLKIVGHLREMTDKFQAETHMNWSCFASPAESTAGSFAKTNRKVFGIIPGVTDRDYITNSFHVPVYYPIKAARKVDIEAPYHELCNAGHISYIEMDGDPLKNLPAFEKIIRYMHDKDMGYFSVNHPVDRCPKCGYTGIIENECPMCKYHDDGVHKIILKE